MLACIRRIIWRAYFEKTDYLSLSELVSVGLEWCLESLNSQQVPRLCWCFGSGPTFCRSVHWRIFSATTWLLRLFPQIDLSDRNHQLPVRLSDPPIPSCDTSIALCWNDLFICLFDPLDLKLPWVRIHILLFTWYGLFYMVDVQYMLRPETHYNGNWSNEIVYIALAV